MKVNLTRLERNILVNIIAPLDLYWDKDPVRKEIIQKMIDKLDLDGSYLEPHGYSRAALDGFNPKEYNDFAKNQ